MSDEKKPSNDNSSNTFGSMASLDVLGPLRSGIKSSVKAANNGLAGLEQATNSVLQPVQSTWTTVETQSKVIGETIKHGYDRRHEYAPHIIGGSALVGGGIMALRRGRVAGVLGGVVSAGLVYGVVYDGIDMNHVPDLIFGSKDD